MIATRPSARAVCPGIGPRDREGGRLARSRLWLLGDSWLTSVWTRMSRADGLTGHGLHRLTGVGRSGNERGWLTGHGLEWLSRGGSGRGLVRGPKLAGSIGIGRQASAGWSADLGGGCGRETLG